MGSRLDVARWLQRFAGCDFRYARARGSRRIGPLRLRPGSHGLARVYNGEDAVWVVRRWRVRRARLSNPSGNQQRDASVVGNECVATRGRFSPIVALPGRFSALALPTRIVGRPTTKSDTRRLPRAGGATRLCHRWGCFRAAIVTSQKEETVRLVLAPLFSVAVVVGCSSVPMESAQNVPSGCDNAQVAKVEQARQPILVERYWVHCPQAPEKPS